MRVLVLVESDDHVCFRYRWGAMRKHFTVVGCQLEALVVARGLLPFYRQLTTISRADVVVLQRRLLAWWKLKLLRRAARQLVFDIDDAIFLRDSNAAQSPHCPRRWRRFCATVRAADLVTAGNEFLVAQAQSCLPTAQRSGIVYVPTVVDPLHYPLAEHRPVSPSTTLVWIGSRSTMQSLHEAQPALAAATREVESLRLKVICDGTAPLEGVNVVACRWSQATESAEISASDIGISWLPDHPWSEGKCGLKVLQYMAAGLPVVANAVGLHRKLIVDGVNGFLAATPTECATAIGRLASSPDLRRKFGAAGRRLIEEQYSTSVWGPQLARLIANVVPQNARQAA